MKIPKTASLLIIIITTISCVQKRHLKTVTFKLDMTDTRNVQNVGIRGEFTAKPWQETVFLKDENNDGIYEGTFSQETAQNKVAFKFVNNLDEYELLDMDNRIITFQYKPQVFIYEAKFNVSNEKITELK